MKIFLRPFFAFLLLALPMMPVCAAVKSDTEEGVEKQVPYNLKGKKILFVITSADRLGTSKMKTGYWLEELAAPYEVLSKMGAEITLASPKGGKPPVDAFSLRSRFLTPETKEFEHDKQAQEKLSKTLVLATVKAEDYDAVFYPAGFGVLMDLVENPESISLIESFSRQRKPMAFLCHAPGVLKEVRSKDGQEIVRGLTVTSLRNSEEAGAAMLRPYAWLIPPKLEALGNSRTYKKEKLPEKAFLKEMDLSDKIPFLVENMLKSEGATYQAKPNKASFTVTDVTKDGGFLITGQNPYSSVEIAQALAAVLAKTDQNAQAAS